MKSLTISFFFIFLLASPLLLSLNFGFIRFTEAGKRRVHIEDDLDDVVDNEEDDAWKEWGKKSTVSSPEKFDPPPSDLSKMDMSQIQAEMMKRSVGPVIGFVKLRLGVRRSPDMISELAMQWTRVLKTGAIEIRFMGVDVSTIMFNLQNSKDSMEVKEFVLNQPEAYEIKIGEQVFRRPGDPPIDEVLEKRMAEKNKAVSEEDHPKEEL